MSTASFDLTPIVDQLSAGVLITDEKLIVEYANDYEAHYYGLATHELVGRDILTCHRPGSAERVLEVVEQMKTGALDEHAKVASGQVIYYKARRRDDGSFAGIVRTRLWLPEHRSAPQTLDSVAPTE